MTGALPVVEQAPKVPSVETTQARDLRAHAHLLGGSALGPAEVVARAGAMQGQDVASVIRAIALRSAPGTTADDVRAAFAAGELVRGWTMRGTVFAVTPADAAGFAQVTAPSMQTALRSRRANLGLTDAHFDLARTTTEHVLASGPVPRARFCAILHDAGLPDDTGHDYHYVSTLAINGHLALGGFTDDGDQMVVPLPAPAEPDEVFLARIARAFFAARGPATADDLAWWLKLPKGVVRRAVAAADGLATVQVDGRTMLVLAEEAQDHAEPKAVPEVVLVPGFDEWILGYQDRSLIASPEVMAQLATSNGIFRPAILVAGRVVGTWAAPTKSRRTATANLIEPVSAAARAAVDEALAAWPRRVISTRLNPRVE